MKKIININLSGRVIPIEDSAYDNLQNYIESLRRYFAREEGRDEIISDIQSRVAELMNDKLRKGAPCVTEDDINEIINNMGRPEDFDAQVGEEATAETNENTYSRSTGSRSGKLYRDTSDKFIGGVCSGLAAYMNIDPAIVRILFAIVTFGGFGLGVLLYIILWIVLPPKDLNHQTGKRLFRNPEEKMIGGVASGLAAYFNASTNTVRIIFAAPFILSILSGIIRGGLGWYWGDFNIFPNVIFGSLTGTFIFIYIVLWIVLPEARSPYEKMEMRGEKVDVNRIKQNVQEGMDNMKDRVQNWSEEVKDTAQQFGSKVSDFASTRAKTFSSEVQDVSRRSGLGHAIGVLFKVFFLFIAGTIAFGLFVALVAILFSGAAWWPINNYLWTSNAQQMLAWGTLIFFFVVPVVALLTWVIRRISGIRSRNNYLGWIFGGLWTIGWVCAILFAANVSRDFRYYENAESPVAITQPSNDKMTVVVSQPELEYRGQFGWMNDESDGWDMNDDSLVLSIVQFDIQPSIDSNYHVVLRKHSYGKTQQDALNRAEGLQYSIRSIDSILDLDNGYAVLKANKFRGQQVEVEIQVPVGKKIRFDASVKEKLNPAEIRVRRGWRNRGRVRIEVKENEIWHNIHSDEDYTMTANGRLIGDNEKEEETKESTDWKNENKKEGYRYEGSEKKSDSIEIEKTIEQKKKEIKELEEIKAKQDTKTTKKVSVDDEDAGAGYTASASALLSMVSGVF